MGESLRARVGRVIAGSVHALLDRIEDQAPEAVMEQAIREVQAVVDDVRHELGLAAANRHLAQQQHARLNMQHETLGAQIEQALRQQADDLARAGVARQLDIEAQIPVLEGTLADLARNETELNGYLAALLARRRDMEEALAEYRRSRALAEAQAAPLTGSAAAERRMASAAAAFEKVFSRQSGVGTAGGTVPLDQAAQLKALDELARRHKIDERLAQWKAAER